MTILNCLQVLAVSATSAGAVKTSAQEYASTVVEQVKTELPELLSVTVIDIESGQALAAHTRLPGLKPARAAPHNAEVVR